jgi:hypothetical protein
MGSSYQSAVAKVTAQGYCFSNCLESFHNGAKETQDFQAPLMKCPDIRRKSALLQIGADERGFGRESTQTSLCVRALLAITSAKAR